ncbi:MAG: hypothetical protein HRU10_03950 [Opitutales bacterium]|nr:hypothetical protein [Opitutales bacterium]
MKEGIPVDGSELRKFVGSTVLLFASVSVTIFLTNNAFAEFSEVKESLTNLKYLGLVFFYGTLVTIAFLVVAWLLQLYQPPWIVNHSRDLVDANKRLETNIGLIHSSVDQNEGNESIVDTFRSLSAELNTIASDFEKLKNYEDLIAKRRIFYTDNADKTMLKLIASDDMVSTNTKQVRLVGTMIGGSGKQGYDLVESIDALHRKRIKNCASNSGSISSLPFEECFIACPGLVDEDQTEINGLNTYVASARHFALTVLKNLSAKMAENDRFNANVSIYISYKGTDTYPAWHMWGDSAVFLLHSLGFTHRKEEAIALGREIPVAMSAINDGEENIFGDEIERLKNHFENDLFFMNEKLQHERWNYNCMSGVFSLQNINVDAGRRVEATEPPDVSESTARTFTHKMEEEIKKRREQNGGFFSKHKTWADFEKTVNSKRNGIDFNREELDELSACFSKIAKIN